MGETKAKTLSGSHLGLTYRCVPGFRPLALDLHLPAVPAPDAPLVVYIHGGAYLEGDRRVLPVALRRLGLFERLTGDGLAVASIDYRLSGEAHFPAQLHDVKAAVRWLRAHREAYALPSRVVVWGESVGAHLAAMAGVTSGNPRYDEDDTSPADAAVQGVIDWYGPIDFLDMKDPHSPESHVIAGDIHQHPELAAQADPTRHIGPGTPPFLIMHGTDDHVVPVRQSERLVAALRDADVDVTCRLVDGADHGFEGHDDVESLYSTVRRFIDGL